MSLNYDLTKIENVEDLKETVSVPVMKMVKGEKNAEGWTKLSEVETGEFETVTRLKTLTECLIFSTMSVDIGEITQENYMRFFVRIDLLQRHGGPYLIVNGNEPYYITLEDIRRHIGLKCNVSYVSDSEWIRGFYRRRLEDVCRENKIAYPGFDSAESALQAEIDERGYSWSPVFKPAPFVNVKGRPAYIMANLISDVVNADAKKFHRFVTGEAFDELEIYICETTQRLFRPATYEESEALENL